LSEAEIKRMVSDAETHAEEDKKFRELVGARNKADAAIHSVEKALKDVGGRDKVHVATKVGFWHDEAGHRTFNESRDYIVREEARLRARESGSVPSLRLAGE